MNDVDDFFERHWAGILLTVDANEFASGRNVRPRMTVEQAFAELGRQIAELEAAVDERCN